MWLDHFQNVEILRRLFGETYRDSEYHFGNLSYSRSLIVSLVSLGLPREHPKKWVEKGYNGFEFDVFFDATSVNIRRLEQRFFTIEGKEGAFRIASGYSEISIAFRTASIANVAGATLSISDFEMEYGNR